MKDNQFEDLMRNRLQNHESSVPADMWQRITENKRERKGGFALRLSLLIAALAVFGFADNYFFRHKISKSNKDVAFEKNNLHSTIIKKDINRQSFNKKISTGAVNIKKPDNPGKIGNGIQRNKQIAKYFFSAIKKGRRRTFFNQRQFFKPVDILKDDSVLTNHRKTQDHQNNNIDSLIQRLTKESNASKPDSAENPETKEDEIDNDKFSVEVYLSPDMPVNRISSANKSYEQILKTAGTTQLSYTFGARINYEITKKISAKMGIQYAQVNEKIAFADSGQGHNFTSANRYKNVGVPLLICYKTNWMSNLKLSVNTGIILSIASRYKGVIPSVSRQPIDIKSDNVYDKNISAALYLGTDISKRINRRTDIFTEPWFSYRFKNMANPFYLFHQKIHTSGLSLGLRYRLFKNEAE